MAHLYFNAPVVGKPGEVHTTPRNALGTEATDNDGNTYRYMAGNTSVAANNAVTYDSSTNVVARGAASARGPVAVASAALIASTYGWFGVDGTFAVTSATNIADGGSKVGVIASGAVDDAWASGDQIVGMSNISHSGSDAFCLCNLSRPYVGVTGTGTA